MAWDHLSITKSHLVYIILGGFTSLFMLCSSVIKERMYIGEATVATLCGVIFGPHAANLIDPKSWGNVDEVTLEFSRIVLVVQCFAVGVELPKFYMEKHWKSVVFLLLPVMTWGWLVTSLFIWWMIKPLNWLESLAVAACVTATDPVLASSVVGKGKFAKRVPKHLRDLLSAESGCNDGMAFPFIYLAVYLIQDHLDAKDVTFHWIVYTILYECLFGAIYGFTIGYIARHGIKFAEKRDLIDRESFLVFYFTLALFCAGSGSILGVDDLLVGFAAGVGFSNDGWFSEKTEESHVSNVIDLLLNLAYFVYLGTIIPWEQYNNPDIGLTAWRLSVIAIFVIFFRRIPIMMLLKPFIPDIKTWREALFAGHFGPIGVGAIFIAILARAEIETEKTIPLAELPPDTVPHYNLIALVWPITTFLVISSILVHGSSIAVFTLGKHINTLSLTMSYTQANEDGPSWMNRLPRISSQSRSQARTMSDTDAEELKLPEYPPGTLPVHGFLRRQRDEEGHSRAGSRSSSIGGRRRKHKKWDNGIGPGGPVSESAIFPQRRSTSEAQLEEGKLSAERRDTSGTYTDEKEAVKEMQEEKEKQEKIEAGEAKPEQLGPPEIEIYDEGDHIIIEDGDGQVVAVDRAKEGEPGIPELEHIKDKTKKAVDKPGWTYDSLKKKLGEWHKEEVQKRKGDTSGASKKKHEPARAYQFGNTIIVEDEYGEVVKKYELPSQRSEGGGDIVAQSLKYMGMGAFRKTGEKSTATGGTEASGSASEGVEARPSAAAAARPSFAGWKGFSRTGAGESSKKPVIDESSQDDDRHIRFTIGGQGRRMTKEDFIQEVRKMEPKKRKEVVEQSDAPQQVIKTIAKQVPGPVPSSKGSSAHGDTPKDTPKSSQHPSPSPATRKALETAEGSSNESTKAGSSSSQSPEGRDQAVPSSSKPEELVSNNQPETAVERRRRLAALSGIEEDDSRETPAERRRREAALGVSGGGGSNDSDSEDDDTPRVPPARRGIRFADTPERGRQ